MTMATSFEPACSGGACDINIPEGAEAIRPLQPAVEPLTTYMPSLTLAVRVRRCAWKPGPDEATNLLCDDACHQLELAQCEIDRLSALTREANGQMEFAWELLATHEYPAEDHEVDYRDMDEDWEEEKS